MPSAHLRPSKHRKLDWAECVVEREANGSFSGYVMRVFAAADSARSTRVALGRALAAHRALLASLACMRRDDKGVGNSDGTLSEKPDQTSPNLTKSD